MDDFMKLVNAFGPTVAVCIAFLWITLRRQEKLEARQQETEAYIRDKLMDALKENSKALERHTAAVEGMHSDMKERPCLLEAAGGSRG